jgi:hypothetical protein
MPRLAKEQSEICIVCAIDLFNPFCNGRARDASASAIVPCRDAPDAANFNSLPIQSGVAYDDCHVADERVGMPTRVYQAAPKPHRATEV